MTTEEKVRNRIKYGRTLVHSGVSGLRNGRDSHLHGHPLSEVLTDSARGALGLAVVGTCAALVGSCFSQRNRRVKAVGYGVAASVIGLMVGLAWKTRELTSSMGRAALKEIGTARDEHWLQSHPIDYA